jgi:hypothetical protein
MKRRSVLRSLVTLPAVAAARAAAPAQKPLVLAQEKGGPAGLPLVPPGITETPNIPVIAPDETADSINRTFDQDQLSALSKLGELIVPSWNGLPGATEAGAADFLDFLAGCSAQPRLELYRNGLDTLNRKAQEHFGHSFAMLSADQAAMLLSPLHAAWEFSASKEDEFLAFLQMAKADLLRATFNSRPYIDALSQQRRPRNASGFYWYPVS